MKLLVGFWVVRVIIGEGFPLLEVRSHAKRIDFLGHRHEVLHDFARIFVDGLWVFPHIFDFDSEQIEVLHAADLDVEILELIFKGKLTREVLSLI